LKATKKKNFEKEEKMKRNGKKILALTLALTMVLLSFSPAKIINATQANTWHLDANEFQMHDGSLITQEVLVEGISIEYTTTVQLANVMYTQEIVDIAGVPLLITIYDFGWYSFEVGTLLRDAGDGVFRAVPSDSILDSSSFEDALAAFYAERFDIHVPAESRMRLQYHEEKAIPYTEVLPDPFWLFPETGSHSDFRSERVPGFSHVWLDLDTRFDFELRLGTNWANPVWQWDRVWFRNLDVVSSIWPAMNSHVAERLTIEIAVITHGYLPVSFDLSLPPSINLSPSNGSRSSILSHTAAPNALYARITSWQPISVYRQSLFSRFDLATLEIMASIGVWSPAGGHILHHGLTTSRITASFGLSGPMRRD
jgi:hypothetical protein